MIRATAPQRTFLGAILLTVSWIFFTTEMVTVRLLSEDLSVAQIGVFRLGTQALVLLPVVLWTRGRIIHTRRLRTHIARGACSTGAMVLFYLAFVMAK